MPADPLLILQMRRMGDLILTFPLILDLRRLYPQNPIWVVGEPQFYEGLRQFTPEATFFPATALPALESTQFQKIINLSGSPAAAIFTEKAKAAEKFGPAGDSDKLHINGFWQIYRSALIRNNRHNLFHWADLFRLDFVFPLKNYVLKKPKKSPTGRVGIFLGASEPSKRPDADFWAALVRRLVNMGIRPVIMGGPGEKKLGDEVARRTAIPSFCGKTNLQQLASLVHAVDLFITPDTGPMHLADWLGTQVLNLSLGNVSPHETGPVSPNQWICQASISCAGCWQCSRGRQYCRSAFTPGAVAAIVENILRKEAHTSNGKLVLYKTGKTEQGFHELLTFAERPESATQILSRFWRAAFLYFAGCEKKEIMETEGEKLALFNNSLLTHMDSYFGQLLRQFMITQKTRQLLPADFWQKQPQHGAFFAGHCQMWLQNANYDQQAWKEVLERTIKIREIFSPLK